MTTDVFFLFVCLFLCLVCSATRLTFWNELRPLNKTVPPNEIGFIGFHNKDTLIQQQLVCEAQFGRVQFVFLLSRSGRADAILARRVLMFSRSFQLGYRGCCGIAQLSQSFRLSCTESFQCCALAAVGVCMDSDTGQRHRVEGITFSSGILIAKLLSPRIPLSFLSIHRPCDLTLCSLSECPLRTNYPVR